METTRKRLSTSPYRDQVIWLSTSTHSLDRSLDHALDYSPHIEASGFNSPEPDVEVPMQRSAMGIPRQVGLVAGMAVAITAGTISQIVNQEPQYEGTFQLTVQPQSVQPQSNGETTVPAPQIEDVNQTISEQTISETQVRILESPRLLEPIVAQLQTKNPDLDFHEFTKNLDITVQGDRHLEVRYRDTSPERIQFVLEQLAQTYVEYGQDCRDSACQGLKFVDAQIPQIQQRVTALRTEIQTFHQQYGLKNLEGQVRLFSNRSVEISRQQAELEGKLTQARQQYSELQARMALQPNEAIAQAVLDRNPNYQPLLKQFQEVDRQLVLAMSSYRAEDAALQALNQQHQTLVAQLNQAAAQALAQYLANPDANLQDPIFQEPQLLQLLQQSIGATHYIHMLEVRQQTIVASQQAITQRKHELANALRHYADLRQQLQSETQILQQYIDKRDFLQAQSAQQKVSWQLVAPPELLTNDAGKPVADHLYSLREDLGSAAVFGTLLGAAIAIVCREKQNRPIAPLTKVELQEG